MYQKIGRRNMESIVGRSGRLNTPLRNQLIKLSKTK